MKKTKYCFISYLFLIIFNFSGTSGEPPSYKYSRDANVKVEDEIYEGDDIKTSMKQRTEDDINANDYHEDYHSDHDHSHIIHGYSHSDNLHSHNDKRISYGEKGHSHGKKVIKSAEDYKQRKEKLYKTWDEDDDLNNDALTLIWKNAILSTFAISAAPFFILFLIPLDNSKEKEYILKVLLGFASGGLLGDSFLHLIPHAMIANDETSTSHGHGHSHGENLHGNPHNMTVGLGVLSGIIAFLVVEKFVHFLNGASSGHSHCHVKPSSKKVSNKNEKIRGDKLQKPGDKLGDPVNPDSASSVKVSGYLNLVADTFHNFTDGLAIGSSFLVGNSVGFVTVLTILFHEIPHEIGDFAILIRSGVDPSRAILLQLITAIGALVGCILALALGGSSAHSGANVYILPFTAGGFIYIATVSVIPELLSNEKSSFSQSVMEVVALLLGVAMMVIIAHYE